MNALSSIPLVLLTGATGWLGKRVAEALTTGLPDVAAGGVKVRALVAPHERTDALQKMGIECVVGDLTDADARAAFVKTAEGATLIHLAGLIHPQLFVKDFERVNHLGTLALYNAAAAARVKRVVVMSSNSPIGTNPSPDHLFDENSPYNPYMGYGRSKMRMEMGLKSAMQNAGAPETVILRAPWFYGPGQPPRQTLFFSMVKNGKFPIMGAGANRRSMGYVDSLAQGIVLAATSPKANGQIYWLADERPYSMAEIVGTVKSVLRDDFGLQVADKDWVLPPIVADIARLADWGLQTLGLYQQKIHVLSEMNVNISCRIDKAKAELGYKPIVELREGMRRSIDACLKRGDVI